MTVIARRAHRDGLAPVAEGPEPSATLFDCYWKVMLETYWLMSQVASVSVLLVTALP